MSIVNKDFRVKNGIYVGENIDALRGSVSADKFYGKLFELSTSGVNGSGSDSSLSGQETLNFEAVSGVSVLVTNNNIRLGLNIDTDDFVIDNGILKLSSTGSSTYDTINVNTLNVTDTITVTGDAIFLGGLSASSLSGNGSNLTTNFTLSAGGDVDSVTTTITSLDSTFQLNLELKDTGVSPNTYGSGTNKKYPVITIDADGRITNASEVTIIGTDNEIEVTGSSTQVQIGLPNNVTIGNNLIVTGNLTVNGTTVTQDVTTVLIEDPVIKLANGNNTSDNLDIGFYGEYGTGVGTAVKYTGLIRDVSLPGPSAGYVFFDGTDTNILSANTTGDNDTPNVTDYADVYLGRLFVNTNDYNADNRVTISGNISGDGNLNIDGTVTLSGVAAGTDNTVLLLNSSNQIIQDEIDSRVFGSSLVDGTGIANHVAFWTDSNTISADSSQLYWDSTNNRLGIGTNNPVSTLHVKTGSVDIQTYQFGLDLNYKGTGGWARANRILIDSVNDSTAFWGAVGDDSNGVTRAYLSIADIDTDPVGHLTGTGIHLLSNGNVGIGSISPSYKLDVIGDIRATTNMYLGQYLYHDGDVDTYLDFYQADGFRIVTGGVERIRVNNTETVFNEGSNNYNFRVESDNETHLIFVNGGTDSIGIATTSGTTNRLSVESHNPTISVNGTNYYKATYSSIIGGYNIASGVTDSGYRIALDASSYVSDSDFAGTLDRQYSIWARHGAYISTSGSTINTSIGVYIDSLTNAETTITNLYGLYQASSSAKNYFGGTVGIGITAPSYKLDVIGDIRATTNMYLGQYLYHDGDIDTALDFYQANGLRIVTGGQENIRFNTTETVINENSNIHDFRVESNNNPNTLFVNGTTDKVGIGTNAPDYLLTINDTAASGAGLKVIGGDGGGPLAQFVRDSSEIIEINASGLNPQISFQSTGSSFSIGESVGNFKISRNSVLGTNDILTIVGSTSAVGIGTTNPLGKLHVAGTNDNSFIFQESKNATDGPAIYAYKTRGTVESPTNVQVGDELGGFGWLGLVDSVQAGGSGIIGTVEAVDTGANKRLSSGIIFSTRVTSSASRQDRMTLSADGGIRFHAYGSGNFTGSAAYNLSVDSSGNIIETSASIDGSGTQNRIPLWSDSNTLTDSIITQSGSSVTVGIGTVVSPVTLNSDSTYKSIDIGGHSFFASASSSINASASGVLFSMPVSGVRSGKVVFQCNINNSSYEIAELLFIHNNTTVYTTEYGNIATGANIQITYTARILSNNVDIIVENNSASTCTVVGTLISRFNI